MKVKECDLQPQGVKLASIVLLCTALVPGCIKKPPFYTLSGAYQTDSAARSMLGRCLRLQHGSTVEPLQIFGVAYSMPNGFQGTEEAKQGIRAALEGSVKAAITDACSAETKAAARAFSVDETDITFASALEPATREWIFDIGQNCCSTQGSVKAVCENMGVIVSLYRTRVDHVEDISARLGAGVSAQCNSTADASIKLDVSAGSKLRVTSDGWNVAKVLRVEEVCTIWSQAQEIICRDGKKSPASIAACPADYSIVEHCCGPQLSCPRDFAPKNHVCEQCPVGSCAKPGSSCIDKSLLRSQCPGDRRLDVDACECGDVIPCPQGQEAVDHVCRKCGSSGYPCCGGSQCGLSLICQSGTCVPCGAPGQVICSGSPCGLWAVRAGPNCVHCGGNGEPICDTAPQCASGNVKSPNTNSCVSCGGIAQPCCQSSSCGSGAACWNGTCLDSGFITNVDLVVHTEDDDKDKEEPVMFAILRGGQELAAITVGGGVKWPDQTTDVWHLNFASPSASNGMSLRVRKHPHGSATGCGWKASFEVRGHSLDGGTRILLGRTGVYEIGDGHTYDFQIGF